MDLESDESKPSVSKNAPILKSTKRSSSSPLSLNASTSKDARIHILKDKKDPFGKRCMNYLYNKENKTFCERTCKSWLCMFVYAIMYLIFLATYTLIFLYGTLMVMKYTIDYQSMDKAELFTYSEKGIGLSATPSTESNYPIIWYRKGEESDVIKYVDSISKLFRNNRRKRGTEELGPCGKPPYGYGETPCIIIRINKQWNWAGQPLQLNSTMTKDAPIEVQEWIRHDRKLWLQCDGYHLYDKEHIGVIKYYPDPPGFDPKLFPLDMDSASPLVAIQISNFSIGVSLAVECKLWYESGISNVEFMLYVAPNSKQ